MFGGDRRHRDLMAVDLQPQGQGLRRLSQQPAADLDAVAGGFRLDPSAADQPLLGAPLRDDRAVLTEDRDADADGIVLRRDRDLRVGEDNLRSGGRHGALADLGGDRLAVQRQARPRRLACGALHPQPQMEARRVGLAFAPQLDDFAAHRGCPAARRTERADRHDRVRRRP